MYLKTCKIFCLAPDFIHCREQFSQHRKALNFPLWEGRKVSWNATEKEIPLPGRILFSSELVFYDGVGLVMLWEKLQIKSEPPHKAGPLSLQKVPSVPQRLAGGRVGWWKRFLRNKPKVSNVQLCTGRKD